MHQNNLKAAVLRFEPATSGVHSLTHSYTPSKLSTLATFVYLFVLLDLFFGCCFFKIYTIDSQKSKEKKHNLLPLSLSLHIYLSFWGVAPENTVAICVRRFKPPTSCFLHLEHYSTIKPRHGDRVLLFLCNLIVFILIKTYTNSLFQSNFIIHQSLIFLFVCLILPL